MPSPAYNPNNSKGLPFSFGQRPAARTSRSFANSPCPQALTALNIEFVAKPDQAHRVQSIIPAALAGALKDVSGFAGCLVMISDQEARLVTVVTLWTGSERLERCRENIRWVQKLLAPYQDRCLRVQTLVAHLPAPCLAESERNPQGGCAAMPVPPEEGEAVCVA